MEPEANVNIGENDSSVSSQNLLVPGPNAVDITPNKDGGVLKEIIREGSGDDGPCEGEQVYVHYVGMLPDGTKFDSSRDRGEKFDFILGKGRVIKSWDIGVATMKRGEVCKLYCRGDYAYGETGSPPKIPPNATLIFEVELFDWKMEDLSKAKDGGILRRTIKKGEGYTTPNEGALVNVHIVGKHKNIRFDDRELQFNLGEGSEHGVPEGIETALERFKKGEKSLLKLTPAYAFGSSPRADLGLPADAEVEYEVELKSFEKAKESWEFDTEEKLEQAKILKDKGTQYFKDGKYVMARKQYKNLLSFVEFEKTFKDEKLKERDQLVLAGHLNIAMCALKLENHIEARDSAAKALEIDPDNEKGLFRRGQAYVALSEPDLALRDFEKIIAKDPNNKAALNQAAICRAKVKELSQKEKQLYSNIFRKMAEQDRNACGNNAWSCGWWDDKQRGVKLEVDLEKVDREKWLELEAIRAERRKEVEAQKKRADEIKQAREEEARRKAEEAKRLEEEAKLKEAGGGQTEDPPVVEKVALDENAEAPKDVKDENAEAVKEVLKDDSSTVSSQGV